MPRHAHRRPRGRRTPRPGLLFEPLEPRLPLASNLLVSGEVPLSPGSSDTYGKAVEFRPDGQTIRTLPFHGGPLAINGDGSLQIYGATLRAGASHAYGPDLPPEPTLGRYDQRLDHYAVAVSGHYAFVNRGGASTEAGKTSPSVIRIDLDTGEITPFLFGNQYVRELAVGLDGVLYIGSGINRVTALDPETLKSPDPERSVPSLGAYSLTADAAGNLYGYDLDGLSKYGPDGKRIASLGRGNSGFDDQTVSDLAADPDGSLWVAYRSGVIARMSGDLSRVESWFDSGLRNPYIALAGAFDDPPPPPPPASTILIADSRVVEGGTGSRELEFELTRTGDLSRRAGVAFEVTRLDGGVSYVGSGINPISFVAGQSSLKVRLAYEGDPFDLGDRTVRVRLVEPFRAAIGRGEATGTIVEDDPSAPDPDLPTVSISDTTTTEGEPAVFTVTLSSPVPYRTRVTFHEADGTRSPVPGSYSAEFQPGETTTTLSISTQVDDTSGADRTIVLQADPAYFNFANNGRAVATIRDTPTPKPRLSVEGGSATEGDAEPAQVRFTLRLDRPYTRPVTADYRIDGAVWRGNVRDQPTFTGTVTFAPGETTQVVTLDDPGDLLVDDSNDDYNLTITRADVAVVKRYAGFVVVDNEDVPDKNVVIRLDRTAVTEGDDGYVYADVWVEYLSRGNLFLPVQFQLSSSTAKVDSDYSPDVTYEGGTRNGLRTTSRYRIAIVADTFHETDEDLNIRLVLDPERSWGYQVDPAHASATLTIVDNDPEIQPKALAPLDAAEAVDADLDGAYDAIRPAGFSTEVARDATHHSAVLLRFDVGGVVLSAFPDASLTLVVSWLADGSAPVRIIGIPGGDRLNLAAALAPGTLLGTFTPDRLGPRTIRLDPAAIAAVTKGSRWLTIRLDMGEGRGRSQVFTAVADGNRIHGEKSDEQFFLPRLGYLRPAPVLADDAATLSAVTSIVVPVLANDGLDPAGTQTIRIITQPKYGYVSIAGNAIRYTPNSWQFSASDSFTYTIERRDIYSEESRPATVTIRRIPRLPDIRDASYGRAVATGTLPIDASNAVSPWTVQVVRPPAHGTVEIRPNGDFTYTPARNYAGKDTFSYTVRNAIGTSRPAEVSLQVVPGQAPIAVADRFSVAEDGTLRSTSGVLGNDRLWATDGRWVASLATAPAHGTVTLGEDGRFTYTPKPNYAGTDFFTYSVELRSGAGTDTYPRFGTVTIDVRPANDAPVAVGESYSLDEDTPLAVAGLLQNDADVDGNALTAVLVDRPRHGAVTLDRSGRFVYVPAKDYSGLDRFTYRASDGSLLSNLATVTLTVRPVDDAPTATADRYAVALNRSLTVAGQGVLANDRDPEGSRLTATLVSGPPASAGKLVFRPDGTFVFTPKKNVRGTFAFQYRVSDGRLNSAPATVTLTVGGPTIKRARRKA